MAARPAAISFEAANPRHEHEWEDVQGLDIPDHKILIPGVIDSTTNFIGTPKASRAATMQLGKHCRSRENYCWY